MAKLAAAFALLGVLGITAAIIAFPAIAALPCPECYGLDQIEANVFVDHNMSSEERTRLVDVLAEARRRVRGFFGGYESNPRILVCSTDTCYRHIGGGRRFGASFLDVSLILSPRAIDPTTASHELSHIELRHRLGLLHSVAGSIPAWFQEGVAVTASGEASHSVTAAMPGGCHFDPDMPVPGGMFEWNKRPDETERDASASSACRVGEWMSRRGGSSAVQELVALVSAGARFSQKIGRAHV
jgi:hypothetical protein